MVGTLETSNNAAGFAAGANTAGGTLTAALSGGASGTAWDRLIIPGDVGAGNTLEITTSPTVPSLPAGNKWYHAVQASATPALKVYKTMASSRTIGTWDFYLNVAAAPASGAVNILQIFSDNAYGSSLLAVNVNINSSRTVFLRNGKTGEAANGSNSAAALALNTTYFCQLLVNYSTLTATLNCYLYGSNTVAVTATVAFTTSNTLQSWWWGLGTASAAAEIYITNIRQGYGDVLSRPDQSPSGPVITQSQGVRRTYQAGTAVLMPWSATDPDNVTGLAGSWLSLPTGVSAPTVTDSVALTGIGTTTASRTESFTPSAPGTYVRQITATDGTTPTTALYTLEIYPAVETYTNIRNASKGAFTVVGSTNDTAGAISALNDTDQTTLLDSVVTPSGMSGWVQFGPLGPSGIVLDVAAKVPDGGTLSRVWRVYKEDHTTLIYTVMQSGITGSAGTVVPLVLDNAALSAVAINSPTDVGRAALFVDWADTVV